MILRFKKKSKCVVGEGQEEKHVAPVESVGGFTIDRLKIKPMKTVKDLIKQRVLMDKHIIPKHPASVIFNGSSGSGKTVLLSNLLTRPEFYGGKGKKKYFDEIHLFSPTGGSDDLFKTLKVPEKNIHTDLNIRDLEDILEKRKSQIEKKGVDKVSKMLVIFEDVQGNKKFMKSKPFLKSFIANRHYGISTWLCGQSFTRTPRACRLQANNIFYFKGSGSELTMITDEFCPPGKSKREFKEIVSEAIKEPYAFLHIVMKVPHAERYRKCLGHVVDVS